MDTVRVTIGGVDQPIVREVERQVSPEFFGHRSAWLIFTVFVVSRDFRKFVAVGAPSPLERKVVQRKNHDAPTEIVVRHVDLVRRFVDSYFFDPSDNHRSRRRILFPESRLLRRCLRCCIGLIATGATTAAPTIGGGHGNESRHGAGAALSRNAWGKRWGGERLSLRRLGHVRYFTNNLPGLWIVLANGVLSDVHEPLAVNVHPVPLRCVKGTNDVPLLVEVN